MHSESVAIFAALSDEQLRAKVETPAGIPITAWKWLRAMVEHEVHHRGQIYAWLGILEIPAPPLYGLTSEEVLERSNPLAIPSPLAIPNPLVIPSEVEGSVHSARGARSGRDDKEGATPSE
jgi:hypothetical protein